jgi:hypothetical protein
MDEPRDSWRPYLLLLGIFIVSRIAYFAAGVRFDARPIEMFYQNADPLLLRTRMVETLFYLHMQPPAFNLSIGVILKLFPEHFAGALHAIYLLLGVSLCFTLYRLMRILGAVPPVAVVVAAIFLVSPGVVLFENLLMYEYVLMAVLCAAAVLFHRLLVTPGLLVASIFFFALGALVYLRALFQLGWLVALIAFTMWLLKGRRRMILVAAAVPFALCLGLYVKNLIVFGTFNASTWMGFNAQNLTLGCLTGEEHRRLVDQHMLSTVGLTSQYSPISAFQSMVRLPAPTGIPVLDQVRDSTGRVNYNNLGYLAVHPYFISDAKQVLRHYPVAYLRSLMDAWYSYFLPTGDFVFLSQNRSRIRSFDRWFNRIFFGEWTDYLSRAKTHKHWAFLNVGIFLMVGLPLLFLINVSRLWTAVTESGWNPRSGVLAFVLFNIAFLTAVVNLLSNSENNRYRLPLDPLYAALLAASISRGRIFTRVTRKCTPGL